MALKMGKTNAKAVQADKERREKSREGGPNFYKWKGGANFVRMLPPAEGRDLPWEIQRKHFNLGPSESGVNSCTKTGKDCFSCKMVKIDSQSKDKKKRLLADRRKVSISNVFQMVDVTPLYTKKGKGEFIADNPPPDCWGQIEKDEDGDPIGKCQRCDWNESCSGGVQIAALSGKRIDDISEYFDDKTGQDPTSLRDGMNIKVVKKGKTFGNISYSIESGEDYKWRIPKEMRKFIEEHFKDLTEITKPATPQETEEAWKGKQDEGDLPECFGEFEEKKKCKQCEFSEICAEETEISEKDEKPKKKTKIKDEDYDDDEEEDDEEEKPKKKKAKVKEEEEDEEEEEEEEGEEEEDEEDEKPKKKKVKPKLKDEDEEEEEEEDEEEEDEEDKDDEKEEDILESLNRSELKEFIKNNDLQIKITKQMDDDEIRKSIRENLAEDEEEDEDEEEEKNLKDEIKKKLKQKAKK